MNCGHGERDPRLSSRAYALPGLWIVSSVSLVRNSIRLRGVFLTLRLFEREKELNLFARRDEVQVLPGKLYIYTYMIYRYWHYHPCRVLAFTSEAALYPLSVVCRMCCWKPLEDMASSLSSAKSLA